jgi:hypothetical protein
MASTLKKRSSRWLHLSMLLISALILLLLSLDFSDRFVQQTQSATLFCFYRNFWMTVAPLPARPVDLGAYFEGNLWLATAKGVYRYDGSRWTESAGALKTKRPAALAASAARGLGVGFLREPVSFRRPSMVL